MSYGAIFDMDGTLLDSMPLWEQAANQFLAARGQTPVPDMIRELEALDIADTASYFKARYCLEESTEEISSELEELVAKGYRETVPLKRDILPFLEKLHEAGFVMCVATATERHLAEAALKRSGLSGYFSFMLTAQESGSKDHPEIFEEACRRLETAKENTTVFEDAFYAIKTAKESGLRVVAIQDESSKNDETAIRRLADQYIFHYKEVSIEWLKSQKKR